MNRIYDQIDYLGGSPRVAGRRLTVYDVVAGLGTYGIDQDYWNDYVNDFDITVEQAKQSLEYCRTQQCEVDKPKYFCHRCRLRTIQDGDEIPQDEIEEFDIKCFNKSENSRFYLNSENEELTEEYGIETWRFAEVLSREMKFS
ncbi:MAG: hypothetical protein AAFQ94_14930 [Bacteroidota bacterium]